MFKVFVHHLFKVSAYSSGSDPNNFDIVIVNDKLDKAYQELKEFLMPLIQEVNK